MVHDGPSCQACVTQTSEDRSTGEETPVNVGLLLLTVNGQCGYEQVESYARPVHSTLKMVSP